MARLKEILGRNIKHYRSLRSYTQDELARLAGTTKKTVNIYESGKGENVTSEMIEKLAKALDVEESDLVNPGEPPKPIPGKPDIYEAFVMVGEFFRRARKGEDDATLAHLVARILESGDPGKKK